MDEKSGGNLWVKKILLWKKHALKCSELYYWIQFVEQWQNLLLNVDIKKISMPMPLKRIFS